MNAVTQAVCDVLFRSEDDPLYTLDGAGPDDPPLPRWSAGSSATPDGRRSFEGLYSFLAMLQSSAVTSPFWDPATPVTLTIITFQRRDADHGCADEEADQSRALPKRIVIRHEFDNDVLNREKEIAEAGDGQSSVDRR